MIHQEKFKEENVVIYGHRHPQDKYNMIYEEERYKIQEPAIIIFILDW